MIVSGLIPELKTSSAVKNSRPFGFEKVHRETSSYQKLSSPMFLFK
jgi:hypothetical protein